MKISTSAAAVLLVLLLTSGVVLAQPPLALDSILKVIQTANPMLKKIRYRADAMTAYAAAATSHMAPEVGGGAWMLPYPGATVMDQRDKGQYMLSIQQKFTNPAKLRASQSYLHSKSAIEKADEAVTYNDLKLRAKTAYYQWLVLEKRKHILRDNEQIMHLLLKITHARYPYNQARLSNVYKAEVRLSEIENMLLMNENEIVQKNILLNQLMNIPSEIRYAVDTTAAQHYSDFAPAQVDTTTLATTRSDIEKIDRSIQSMQYYQALEAAQSKPDFTISYNHMIPRGAGMPGQYTLVGMISIPIAPWSSKMYTAAVRGMRVEIDAMRQERESLLSELQHMLASQASEINTLRQQLYTYEKRIIPALQKNYETLLLAYQQNREELPMVIDAFETASMARLQHLDTLKKYYEMVVEYERLLEK